MYTPRQQSVYFLSKVIFTYEVLLLVAVDTLFYKKNQTKSSLILDSLYVDRWKVWVKETAAYEFCRTVLMEYSKSTVYYKKRHFYTFDRAKNLVAPHVLGRVRN